MKDYNETITFLNNNGIKEAEIGIILGTGLGQMVNEISIEKEIDYSTIPNFPVSTIEFHKGKLIYGSIEGKTVIALQGRFHLYEGYTVQEVSFPVRILKLLGIQHLLISNAAGAVNLDFKKGNLMLVTDHINLHGGSPLAGTNNEDHGPRFPDMSEPYSNKMNNLLIEIAKEKAITLHTGVYASVFGPQLETRAEYRYIKIIGADAVGMSTVPEVIVANHMSLPCIAISVLTDECDPDNLKPVNIQEIIEIAGKAEPKLITLFLTLIQRL